MNDLYQSTKVITLGSCAFRQWRTKGVVKNDREASRCYLIHGYRLTAKFVFGCSELDDKNWVMNFGGLKDVKKILEAQFDHTTCIAADDPELETFKQLHQKNIIDLRIMDGVGIEKFAEYCCNTVNEYTQKETSGRCWVDQVEVWEHPDNSVIFKKSRNVKEVKSTKKKLKEVKVAEITLEDSKENEVQNSSTFDPFLVNTEQTKVQELITDNLQSAANPLYATKTPGFSNLFKGTSWGM